MQRHSDQSIFGRVVAFRGVGINAQNLNHGLVRNSKEEQFAVLLAVVKQQVIKGIFLFKSLLLKELKFS